MKIVELPTSYMPMATGMGLSSSPQAKLRKKQTKHSSITPSTIHLYIGASGRMVQVRHSEYPNPDRGIRRNNNIQYDLMGAKVRSFCESLSIRSKEKTTTITESAHRWWKTDEESRGRVEA